MVSLRTTEQASEDRKQSKFCLLPFAFFLFFSLRQRNDGKAGSR